MVGSGNSLLRLENKGWRGRFLPGSLLLAVVVLIFMAAFPYRAVAQNGNRPGEGSTFSPREIVNTGHKFFGTISRGLALTVEEATRRWGEPNGYILGQEASGAFVGGLRYGEGTLYLRSGGTQKVYWHGPSLGYDMGAEGSRTLFLIYSLEDPADLFRRYTGVDGSAYLVGGVGMTLLKGGPVMMAPIRSGIGLRLGASIGYLRFTSRPTWNPF